MVNELLTAALVIITAFYAWVTFRMLRANEATIDAMRQQTIAISRPYIVIAPILELDNPIFYLRISNTGKTAALNLRMTLDKSFVRFGDTKVARDLAEFSVFNESIDAFPPGAEIIFSLVQSFKIFAGKEEDSNLPRTFSITARYEFEGRVVSEISHIDLRPYREADVPQNAYVRKLSAISESIASLANSAKKSV